MDKKTNWLLSILASIFLGVAALLNLINLIDLFKVGFSYILPTLFTMSGSVALLLGLLLRNKILPIVGFGAYFFAAFLNLVQLNFLIFPNLLSTLGYLGGLAMVILAMVMPKFRKIGSKLFFIPSAVLVLAIIVRMVITGSFRFGLDVVDTLLNYLLLPGAIALALLVIVTRPNKRKRPAPGYAASMYAAPQAAPMYAAPQAQDAYANPYAPKDEPLAPQNPCQAPYTPLQAEPSYGQPSGYAAAAQAAPQAAPQAEPQPVSPLAKQLMYLVKPAITAQLKSPASAQFPMELVRVTGNAAQGFQVTGFVDSQNSYGAMIRNDFTATVVVVNGQPLVQSARVGIQAGKQYAKNFAVNYIAISIFVAVVGGLMTLLTFLLTGVL